MSASKLLLATVATSILSLSSVGTAHASTSPHLVSVVATPLTIPVSPPPLPDRAPQECFPSQPPEPVFVCDDDHSKELFTGAGSAVGGAVGGFVGTLFGPGVGTVVGAALGSGFGGMLGSIFYDAFRRPASPTLTAPRK